MKDWKESWESLDGETQTDFMKRLSIMPLSITAKSFPYRLLISPVILFKHYRLNRKHFGIYWSIRYALRWTQLLLLWEFASQTRRDSGEKK